MKAEIEYIFGKHAAKEVLQERPDVVVEAHVAAGDVAAAIRQYEACCQVLKQELGITPGPEIKAYRDNDTAVKALKKAA